MGYKVRNLFLGATLTMALVACTGESNRDYADSAPSPTGAVAYDEVMQEARAGNVAEFGQSKVASSSPPSETGENPTSQSFLAYRYNYGFALPAKAVAATAKSHAELCIEAGPAKCQVLSSNTSSQDSDYVSASLSLRAEPEWLETFKDTLQSSVEEAKGDMTHSGVSAEDLTRSILDTDARLNAQKTLRTRLGSLLETRDAKLPDLLALERELARVQGQIESATTQLNVLRKRVSMSVVDINYQTKQVAVSRGAFSSVGRALKGFVGDFADGLAGVIEFFARVLPWLILVILPGLWLVRRIWRGRKARKTGESTT